MKAALLLLGVACLAGFGLCTKYHRGQCKHTFIFSPPRLYNFFMLNSAETKIYPTDKC